MTFVDAKSLSIEPGQIAVGLTHGDFGAHVGLIFHSAKDGLKLLHLRFHLDLVAEHYPPAFQCWIGTIPDLHKTNAKFLVGIARKIATRPPSIKFGINAFKANGSFDSNGRYHAPKGSDGLTCASFVAQLFRAYAIDLVDIQSWHERPEDVEWGNAVCDLLKKKGATDDHVAAVRGNINGIRLRAEEVAFAADVPSKERPVKFTEASIGGGGTIKKLQEVCPAPSRPRSSPPPLGAT